MPQYDLIEERLFYSVIGAFYEAYNALGYGFLERAYVLALERELRSRSHQVAREVCMQLMYKGEPLMEQRIDMIVDQRLIVEAKSTESLHAAATRQLFNYLKATGLEIGLLLHFGPRPKFYRVYARPLRNDDKDSAHSEDASRLIPSIPSDSEHE